MPQMRKNDKHTSGETMKENTLKTIEKDIGIQAYEFIELNKFMDNSRSGDSLKEPIDFLHLLAGNIGELLRNEAYKKYGSKLKIEHQVSVADCLFILLNYIRSNEYNIEDILRIGIARYKEQIWKFKKDKKHE